MRIHFIIFKRIFLKRVSNILKRCLYKHIVNILFNFSQNMSEPQIVEIPVDSENRVVDVTEEVEVEGPNEFIINRKHIDAINLLIQGVRKGQSAGCYTLQEAAILLDAIKLLTNSSE